MNRYKGFSKETILEYLSYDPETGLFTWTANSRVKRLIGKVAGCINGGGYIQIRLLDAQMLGHHLAWFIMTGEVAEKIDHKDRVTTNNAWLNLRKCTESQNQCNRRFKKNNTGFKNIYITKSNNPGQQYYYNCKIMKDGVSHRATFPFTPEGLEKAEDFVSSTRKTLHGEYACE